MGEPRATCGHRNNPTFDENFLSVGESRDIFAVNRNVDVVRSCRFRPYREIGFEARNRGFGRGFKICEIMLIAWPMDAEATWSLPRPWAKRSA